MRVTMLGAAIALSALSAPAGADTGPGPGPGPRAEGGGAAARGFAPIAPHLNTGIELLGGVNAWSYAWRTHAGVSVAYGAGPIQPSIGIGGTFALGSLQVEDPRALDGMVSLGYYEVGPELRFGVRWVDGGFVDQQVFVSVAYLRTVLDERIMLDAVEGVGGDRGMRAALGVNWFQPLGRAAATTGRVKGTEWNWGALLAPHQVEFGWERSGGHDRLGLTLSYGI